MKEKSPAVILWELAPKEQLKLKTSVFIATVGVIAGVIPYIAASQILIYLMNGNGRLELYLLWMGIDLVSYILKSILCSAALSVSHKATFSVLKDIRLKMLDKLPKMEPGGNHRRTPCRGARRDGGDQPMASFRFPPYLLMVATKS